MSSFFVAFVAFCGIHVYTIDILAIVSSTTMYSEVPLYSHFIIVGIAIHSSEN